MPAFYELNAQQLERLLEAVSGDIERGGVDNAPAPFCERAQFTFSTDSGARAVGCWTESHAEHLIAVHIAAIDAGLDAVTLDDPVTLHVERKRQRSWLTVARQVRRAVRQRYREQRAAEREARRRARV